MLLNHNIKKTKLIMLCCLLGMWQLLSWLVDSNDFPSLLAVLNSFHFHLMQGDMVANVLITLQRVLLSFVIAMLLGIALGILMGVRSWFDHLADGLMIVLLNIPALVTIILSYIWIGLIETAAITAVVFNKFPTVVIMIREGARVVDQELLAVAKVYKVSARDTFFRVFLPQLYPFIIASARSGLALIWKIVLVVELLGRSNGVGFELNTLFQYFDISGILAYTFAFVSVIFIIEWLLFKPFDRLVQKGQRFD